MVLPWYCQGASVCMCMPAVSAQTRAPVPAPDVLMKTQMGNKFYFKSRAGYSQTQLRNSRICSRYFREKNVPDAFEKPESKKVYFKRPW